MGQKKDMLRIYRGSWGKSLQQPILKELLSRLSAILASCPQRKKDCLGEKEFELNGFRLSDMLFCNVEIVLHGCRLSDMLSAV